MKKDIPNIQFKSEDNDDFGFEIVPLKRIADQIRNINHNSQLPHQLKFHNLIFFTQGSGRHFIEFKWYPVKKNTLVYLAKEQVHAFDFSSDLEGYCIVFNEKFLISFFSDLTSNSLLRLYNPQLFSPTLQIPEDSDFIDYFNLLKKEFFAKNTFNKKGITKSLLIILISKAENIEPKENKNSSTSSKLSILQQFIFLLDNNYKNSRNANYYANELAITYKHLNTICREILGRTAKNVIDEFVILQAKRKLINTTMKSTELAYELGFDDSTNFTKYFKKHTGLTPKSFILSMKNM